MGTWTRRQRIMNNELMKEFMHGIATGSIKLSDAPALRKLIHNYLHHFDYQINSSVNSLSSNANYYNNQLRDIANKKWNSIIKVGNNYQQALKNAMAQEYSPKKVHIMTQSTINNNVSQAVDESDKIIDQYYASLSDNTQKSHKLAKHMTELEKRQDRADARQNQSNLKFWCGTVGAFILGAIFSFLAL